MSQIARMETDDGFVAHCRVPPELAVHEGDLCVFEADRIMDYGCVTRLVEHNEAGGRLPGGKALRCATLMDQAKAKENAVMSKMARDTCAAKAAAARLTLRFVRVRYSFDRQCLMITYGAEERPDVKELAKAIGSELNTRVAMTQIGVRDEAAVLGGLGPCGRNLCCATWLRGFDSVNVRMAKTQGLSLNPGAISGMCGRLKCCLRYEYDQYRQMERRVPPDHCLVECPEGRGRVCARNLLREKVRVRLENDRIVECAAGDVKKVSGEKRRKSKTELGTSARAKAPRGGPPAERSAGGRAKGGKENPS
jgi:cell fate regulator YaaT (PSP1 superfamily)